ncbi:galactose-1-phosphate uridylyltransferase [Youxingia wuxianensis]|uniref:Galactose-1-phosphate uridylyltransferase n=1 Tax=Youxingia wuxianensis TaxID=2763678 RepID=A0A926EJD2_9FIRM|nr:galactose-1-phosphate uridylyltransferase [Youxingia wuxianensis]MBC8584448.1 galactose-1-phosphate uridylyltransferase [Youxingia wuxianensis]
MAELRWHPLIKDWIMIASHRQARPQMPKDWCPFCPGSGKVPEDYDVYKYDNDFPALSQNPPVPDDVATDFFKTKEAYGKCEVILYSPGHTTTLPELSDDHVEKLVNLWCERFDALREDEKIKYVFIFENRGEAVGVTMPHPHGQIYGYSVVPKKIQLEVQSAQEYLAEKENCLFCDMLKAEKEFGKRIIFQNEHFTVFLPFFTEYPYGVYIFSNAHKNNISQFTREERRALAITIKHTVGMFDSLFDYKFPYMMCMHNAPVNGEDVSESYHFHIEFFPPMRSADKIKFNASSETGVWAHCNPTCPEETSKELRAAYTRYKDTAK